MLRSRAAGPAPGGTGFSPIGSWLVETLMRANGLMSRISKPEVLWQEADSSMLSPWDLRSINFSTFTHLRELQGHSHFEFSRPEPEAKGISDGRPHSPTFCLDQDVTEDTARGNIPTGLQGVESAGNGSPTRESM